MLIDIVCEIAKYINYIDVKYFCITNNHYYQMLNQIINYKQQLNPFPRLHGRCRHYKIQKEIVISNDNYNWTYMMNELNNEVDKIDHLDLIYGDIVEFEQTALDQPHRVIYNGYSFDHFNYECGIEILPLHYRHIHKNVPIDYWYLNDSLFQLHIQFNFSIVDDQIKNNIIDDNDSWVSFFIYDDYRYNINFIWFDEDLTSHKCSIINIPKDVLLRSFDYRLCLPLNKNTILIHTDTGCFRIKL